MIVRTLDELAVELEGEVVGDGSTVIKGVAGIREAMPGGTTPRFTAGTMASTSGPNGLATILNYQLVGGTKYFDAAGFSGRTVGLVVPAGRAR